MQLTEMTISYCYCAILFTLWPESRMKSCCGARQTAETNMLTYHIFILRGILTILRSKNDLNNTKQAFHFNAKMQLVNIAWGKLKLHCYCTVVAAGRKKNR